MDANLQNNFLKGSYSDEENRPLWAMHWIRDLTENIEKCDSKLERSNILVDWFKDFWQHYEECKVFAEMRYEQDSIDNLDLKSLGFPQ